MEVERKGACGGLQRRLSCERDEEGSGRLPLPNSAAVWVAGAHKAQPCRSGAVWAAALQMREARWATAVRKFTVRAASSGEWKAVCGEILLAPPLPTSLKVDTEDPEKPRIRAPLDLGPNPALEQVSNLPKPQFLICTAGFASRGTVQFMSDSLRPHGLQHARLPCPLPTSGGHSWGTVVAVNCNSGSECPNWWPSLGYTSHQNPEAGIYHQRDTHHL